MMNLRLLMATPALLAALLLAVPCRSVAASVPATAPGATLDSLLAIARERHPELRTMQHEAEAATQRRDAAGTLPDPMFGIELRDVTNAASNGDFSLSPARVGSTRYRFGQTFPPWGQRRPSVRPRRPVPTRLHTALTRPGPIWHCASKPPMRAGSRCMPRSTRRGRSSR